MKYVSILLVFFTMSCSNTSQTGTDNDDNDRVDTLIKRQNLEPEQIQSVKMQTALSPDSVLGLYFGRFEADPLTQTLQQRFDSAEMTIGDDYFYSEFVANYYTAASPAEKKKFYLDPIFGYYTIKPPNTISVFIDRIEGDSIFGKSVCAGNERNLNGVVIKNEGTVSMMLWEPGDDQYDGSFDLLLDTFSGLLSGMFTPYDSLRSAKEVYMSSAVFNYSPDGDEWAYDEMYFEKNISIDSLTVEDVEGHSKQRLRIFRNIIYARHGYSFKNNDIRAFFEDFDWYVPVSTDVRASLTPVEKANIALIKRYEAYAEDYYDDFGR